MAITGHFKMFLMILCIILIHEFGHILMAYILKWKITRVNILPFGALTIFDEDINRPIKEEGLIALSGPLLQIFFTLTIFKGEMVQYSLLILFFNLLPIYPLDGSKFVNLFLNKIISFRTSLLMTLNISVVFLLVIVYKSNFNLLLMLIISFIIFKVFSEYKRIDAIFNRFLLERTLKDFKFKKLKIIRGVKVKKMKKDFRHVFKENRYITEKEILGEMFDFRRKV